MRRLAYAGIMSATLLVPAYATPADEGHAAVEQWIDTFNAHDVAATVELYTPDALVWTTAGRSLASGSDAFTAYFTAVYGSPLTATLGEHATLAVTDDVVVDAGQIDVTNGSTGAVTPLRYHFVLVRTDDGWRIAAHHSSRLPDPPATPAPAAPPAAPGGG